MLQTNAKIGLNWYNVITTATSIILNDNFNFKMCQIYTSLFVFYYCKINLENNFW